MPTILVTGATSGFGLAIGRLFGSKGWNVVGTGRRADRLTSLGQELQKIGSKFLPLTFDVRSRTAVDEVPPAPLKGLLHCADSRLLPSETRLLDLFQRDFSTLTFW